FPTFLDVELASHQDNARFLGSIPPLTLGYVASVLTEAGADVLLLDCPTLGMRLPEAIETVRGFDPDYVGFTLATVDWLSSLAWMEGFHKELGKPVIVGGIHMECYPRETLSHECIAVGLVGHADIALVQLLETHLSGGDLATVPGAVWRGEDGEVIVNPEPPRPSSDKEMPFPARELWPTEKHFSIVSTESHFTAAMSNFGCPFRCEFCILRGDALRQRSALSIVNEMEVCYHEFGIREIDFFDPVFTIKKDRVYEICDELDRRNLKGLIWSIRARTDALDPALLDRMWKSGCRRICYGIESGANQILRRVDKRMKSTDHIREVILATKARGYEVLAFVMIGNPFESRRTIGMTRRLLTSLPIDLVQIAGLFPLPKTPIYQEIVAQTGVDYWREHILHGTPVHPVVRLDTDLTDAEIDRFVTETYMHFYFRPRFARFAFGRMSQPAQLRRGLDAAAGISRTFLSNALGEGRGGRDTHAEQSAVR
ncbi:MAG: radical SAM protein, partial [Myxococcota bacterium]|nr:radical SAM protein [Myxococcota bacterium]